MRPLHIEQYYQGRNATGRVFSSNVARLPDAVDLIRRTFAAPVSAQGRRSTSFHTLGHAKVTMPPEVYAHVLPDIQTEGAATLGALLHG